MPALSDTPVPVPSTDPDAPFRPQRGRVVPLVVAAVFTAIFVAVAVGLGLSGTFSVVDQVALVAFALAVSGFVWRYSAIRAVPGPEGLEVRNLMLTRMVGWDEIVDVRFPDGDPWVTVDLDDGDEVAVMAIQRVDGEAGRDEARRLGRLVARHHRGTASA